jgi:hypothetical protein
MTLTLFGDVLLSVLLTLVADKIGRRRILFAGSFLMVISGTTFAMFETSTGGDCGPFRAIEESTLSQLTTPKTRADVLSCRSQPPLFQHPSVPKRTRRSYIKVPKKRRQNASIDRSFYCRKATLINRV